MTLTISFAKFYIWVIVVFTQASASWSHLIIITTIIINRPNNNLMIYLIWIYKTILSIAIIFAQERNQIPLSKASKDTAASYDTWNIGPN